MALQKCRPNTNHRHPDLLNIFHSDPQGKTLLHTSCALLQAWVWLRG